MSASAEKQESTGSSSVETESETVSATVSTTDSAAVGSKFVPTVLSKGTGSDVPDCALPPTQADLLESVRKEVLGAMADESGDTQTPVKKADEKELVFETDSFGKKWQRLTDDGLLWKSSVYTPTIDENTQGPYVLGRVWVNLKGETADGRVFADYMFEERDFILGEAQSAKGVEIAIATMHCGEQCLVRVHSEKYSHNEARCPKGCPKTKTEENKHLWPLKYFVSLVDSLPPQKKTYEMSLKQQLDYATFLREKGNDRYAKKRFLTAIRLYKKAVQCLNAITELDTMDQSKWSESQKVTHKDLDSGWVKAQLNICVAQIRAKKFNGAVQSATRALERDSANLKALIRRAMAYRKLQRFEDAQTDAKRYLKLCEAIDEQKSDGGENNNAQLIEIGKRELKLVETQLRKLQQKERELYGGFLGDRRAKKVSLYADKSQVGEDKFQPHTASFWTPISDVCSAVSDWFLSLCSKRKAE